MLLDISSVVQRILLRLAAVDVAGDSGDVDLGIVVVVAVVVAAAVDKHVHQEQFQISVALDFSLPVELSPRVALLPVIVYLLSPYFSEHIV